MPSPLLALIVERIRAGGPITVAEYVDLALYQDEHGYYASAAQRSGRRGDFFTSVDLGPVFGELLAVALGRMWRASRRPQAASFDLVEAAAGNGRLSRDILDAAARDDPGFLAAVRLHLVERSPKARADQPRVLGEHATRLRSSGPDLPAAARGVIFANELLDALPPHLVVMRQDGLREVFVDEVQGRLLTRERSPSTPRLEQYLEESGARLQPGWFAEVNLAAFDWVRAAAHSLEWGFLLLIDYGYEAGELYSAARAEGTLTSLRRHASEARPDGPGWLDEPGMRDLTSHVNLSAVRRSAEAEGLATLCIVEQARFLLSLGVEGLLSRSDANPEAALRRRLALKTLLVPGGMGSTHKVMIFAKGLEGLSDLLIC